jgi:hypothetical protein
MGKLRIKVSGCMRSMTGAQNFCAICSHLSTAAKHGVGILDALEEKQLIERRRDVTDRRRHLVSLTAAGKRQLARFRTIVQRVEDEFLAPLDADTRANLHATLLTLAENTDTRFVLDEAVDPGAALPAAAQ